MLMSDPSYSADVAYGFRSESGILTLDVPYNPRNTPVPEEAIVND
jgi:hypothetical protein